ncbi:hypothetical protein Tco_0957918 [Tanacetum coccineum]
MTSFITRFDIKKFDGKNDFGLWQIKMCALMVQQGCDPALETLPADMEAGEKTVLMKKAYSTLILFLGDRVLREVTKETTAAGIWTKLTSLYMTKSLANKLYQKKKLYTYYMRLGMKIGAHIDEFNKLILNLANIDVESEDEDRALMLLTSLPSSYENFVKTLLYGRQSLTMKDVLETLNSRELKKRNEGTQEVTGDELYVRGRSDHSGKAHFGGSSRFKSRGRTGKLKYFICHSEGHLKRDCLIKKSSGFIKKGKRDQDSDSSDDEGNAYFKEALVVFGNDEMTELVMDSGDNRTYTIKGTGKVKIQLHDGSSFILEDAKYVPGLRRSLISLGTLEKKGYTVKMQMGRIKVIKGVHEVHEEKRVWFEVELQGAQGDLEAKDFWVSNDDAAVTQIWLEDNQPEEKINTDCLVKEQEKVHLGIKVGANIMDPNTMPGRQGGPQFEVPARGKDAEYRLCLSVTPKIRIRLKLGSDYLALQGKEFPIRLRIGKVVEDVSEDEDFKHGLWVSAVEFVNANGEDCEWLFRKYQELSQQLS